MTCDKCGTDCKNHHMNLMTIHHIDKTTEIQKIGLCWSCQRTHDKDERNGDTDFDELYENCKTQNCGQTKN